MKKPTSPTEWLSWLVGSDAKQRQRARLALGGVEPEDEIDPGCFVAALSSGNDDVVFWSLVALGGIGPAGCSAVNEIRELASAHHASPIRAQAMAALVRIAPNDPETRVCVRAALSDSNPFVRREALENMITVASASDGDLDAIGELATDSDASVARWSEIAIRNIRANWSDP